MLRKSPMSFALLLGLLLAGCGGPTSHPDSAQRPNQPMFIDPVGDLATQSPTGGGSWFVISNLRAGDREFGILTHFLQTPVNASQTLAITDVSTGKYYLDEEGKAQFSPHEPGFEIKGDNVQWSATDSGMRIQGTLKSGESFDLTLRRAGPPLAYNGTGYFPLFDNAMPTWEYAFPIMETVGTVTVGKTTYQVTGNSWFDRQWFRPKGPQEMAPIITGKASWTWIAAPLSNGDVVAVWDAVGVRDRAWASILRPDGTLTIADVEPLKPGMSGIWTSARSGVKWPSEWSVVIPGTKTKLAIKNTAEGQETFKDRARIEAAAHISGVHEGQPVTGVGYVEMVGNPKL